MKKKILIKLSGKLIDEETFKEMIADIRLLRQQGYVIAIVHGGGKTITQQLTAQNIQSEFKNGLRVTTAEAIKIVEMVLAGQINKQLTRWLNAARLPAVGISGADANLIQAIPISTELGYVGKIEKINPDVVLLCWLKEFIAIIAPTGTSPDEACLNINADISAGSLAAALAVENLIFFTDTDGVLQNGQSRQTISVGEIKEFIHNGTANGGMIPKLQASQLAKESGTQRVKIGAWRGKGTLVEMLADGKIGTEIIG